MNVFLLISIAEFAQNNQKIREYSMTENINEEEQIKEIIRLLINLMVEKNTVAMNQIVAENFTLTHITGYVQSKDDWFAEIESESMKYYSAQEVSIKVKLNGYNAECIIQDIVDARIWGSRNKWRLQQNFQLEKRNSEWIILNSVAKTF